MSNPSGRTDPAAPGLSASFEYSDHTGGHFGKQSSGNSKDYANNPVEIRTTKFWLAAILGHLSSYGCWHRVGRDLISGKASKLEIFEPKK